MIYTVGRDPQYTRNIVAEAPPLITAPVIVRLFINKNYNFHYIRLHISDVISKTAEFFNIFFQLHIFLVVVTSILISSLMK